MCFRKQQCGWWILLWLLRYPTECDICAQRGISQEQGQMVPWKHDDDFWWSKITEQKSSWNGNLVRGSTEMTMQTKQWVTEMLLATVVFSNPWHQCGYTKERICYDQGGSTIHLKNMSRQSAHSLSHSFWTLLSCRFTFFDSITNWKHLNQNITSAC